jgi:hypothetical protein
VGAWPGFYALELRLQISPTVLLNPKNLSSTQLEISNQGFLTVYDLRVAGRVRMLDAKITANIINEDLRIPKLEDGERYTIALERIVAVDDSWDTAVDVTFGIAYKVKWLGFRWDRHYRQRFVSVRDTDGGIHWNAMAFPDSRQHCPLLSFHKRAGSPRRFARGTRPASSPSRAAKKPSRSSGRPQLCRRPAVAKPARPPHALARQNHFRTMFFAVTLNPVRLSRIGSKPPILRPVCS